ncbi:MAG TPA: hypothetical protein VNO54_06585 [Streptosporangiaceae bacterium]|nr:hypothetical protein [Streptosporangiaceae bacterium]
MTYPRDPVSEAFDASARRLLAKAYGSRGEWVSVWLPDPTIRQRTRWAGVGIIDLTGPDRPSAVGGAGGLDAKTRWARAFVRSLNYQHKWYSPAGRSKDWQRRMVGRATGGLRVEVGRHIPASAQFDPADPGAGGLPGRRRVRVQLASGGAAKQRAVTRLADRDRIYDAAGNPAGRWSDPALRDWG